MSALYHNDSILIPSLEVADSFWSRAIGLMGRSELDTGHGLWIYPCGSIHTLFMRFALDVIFLDAEHRVVKVAPNLTPWRMAWGGRRAHSVIEARSGTLATLPQPGDCLRIV